VTEPITAAGTPAAAKAFNTGSSAAPAFTWNQPKRDETSVPSAWQKNSRVRADSRASQTENGNPWGCPGHVLKRNRSVPLG
jgi:hypothetical protein